MMKCILKLFMPKASTMANIAAESICKNVNECDVIKKVADYSDYADKVTKIQQQLVDMLADGKLDEKEEQHIAEMLTPVFQKLIDLI